MRTFFTQGLDVLLSYIAQQPYITYGSLDMGNQTGNSGGKGNGASGSGGSRGGGGGSSGGPTGTRGK